MPDPPFLAIVLINDRNLKKKEKKKKLNSAKQNTGIKII